MEQMGYRKGELTNMEVDGKGRIRIEAVVPSRGLTGFALSFNHHIRYRYHDLKFFTLWSVKTGDVANAKMGVDFYGEWYCIGLCAI